MDPKYAGKFAELERRLLDDPGALDPVLRNAVADEGPVPEGLRSYVDKVQHNAYTVTDQDVRGLRAAGYSEDQLFELTVASAFGAARKRLRAGLDAMRPAAPAAAADKGERA